MPRNKTASQADKQPTLVAIQPTAFFKRSPTGLLQAVNVIIDNPQAPLPVWLHVDLAGRCQRRKMGLVGSGETSHRILLPATEGSPRARFELCSAGTVHDRKAIVLHPQPRYTFYLVHNSHHDLGYTDLPSNVISEHADFIAQALDCCRQTQRFSQDTRFKYTVESAWSVLAFLQRHPQRREELIKYIENGQIELTALFAQETTDLCGHEELIRLLYPASALRRQHNIPISSAELNDIPGVAWGLASVLAGAGVRYFSVGIPDYYGIEFTADGMTYPQGIHFVWDEKKVIDRELPGAFRWQGPDRSEVLFWFTRFGANSLSMWDVDQLKTVIRRELSILQTKGYPYDLVKYQIKSAWGRDNSPPSLRFCEIVRQWNRRWAFPKLLLATNDQFFRAFEKKYHDRLPVFRGALPDTDYIIGAIGTAHETAVNRTTHDRLLSAEKFATLAHLLTDSPYPVDTINRAYENTLLYDEHVWGIGHTYGPAQDAHRLEKNTFAHRAAALTDDVLTKSVNRLADHIDLTDDTPHIVLYNPLSWPRTDVAFCPLVQSRPCGRPLHWQNGKLIPTYALSRDVYNLPASLLTEAFTLVDTDTGQPVPFQILEHNSHDARALASERTTFARRNAAHAHTLVFVAEDIPACGYKTYRLAPRTPPRTRTSLKTGANRIENNYYRITFDPVSTAVTGIYDKCFKRQLLDPRAPHCFNQIFARSSETGEQHCGTKRKIERITTGPVCTTLATSCQLPGCPRVVQELTLYDTIPRIDVANRILRDTDGMLELYAAFPFAVNKATCAFESNHAVIRPGRDQLPGSNTHYYAMQHWAHVFGSGIGITMASVDAPVIEFGGPHACKLSQAHHCVTPPGFAAPFVGSDELNPAHLYSFLMHNNCRTNFQNTQVSDTLFRYAFTFGRGNWKRTQSWHFGWEVPNPLIPVYLAGKQAGGHPPQGSFCNVSPAHIVLTTMKRAEDGDGLILRLIETKGTACDAQVTFPALHIRDAHLVNLVEEDDRPLRSRRHSLTVPVRPSAVTTIRIRCVDGS